jgi:hypothetical protein
MQAWMLRKQELLRYVASTHGTGFATIVQIEFRSANVCDNSAFGKRYSVCRARCRGKVSFERRIKRAFAADSRRYLYSSHLIQRA